MEGANSYVQWDHRSRRICVHLHQPSKLVLHGRRCAMQVILGSPQGVGSGMVHEPPPYTIDSFTILTTTFTTQFDTSRRHDLTTIVLLNLRQEEGEPLRIFIDRFSAITMKIKDLTPNLILMYMMTSLRPGPFADELAMRPPLSMQELRKRAAMFIRVEDMRRYQSNAQSPSARTEIKRTNKEPTPRDRNRPSKRRSAKFSNYAPLNAPRSRILDEVLQAELIPPPRKYQNPPNAYLSKYCHYHRKNGHTTDECDTLRDKIEELI